MKVVSQSSCESKLCPRSQSKVLRNIELAKLAPMRRHKSLLSRKKLPPMSEAAAQPYASEYASEDRVKIVCRIRPTTHLADHLKTFADGKVRLPCQSVAKSVFQRNDILRMKTVFRTPLIFITCLTCRLKHQFDNTRLFEWTSPGPPHVWLSYRYPAAIFVYAEQWVL